MTCSRIAAAMVVGLALPAGLHAQDAAVELPPADQLMEQYLAALGGVEAIMQHTARHANATLDLPAQGITGDVEIFQMAPNLLLVRTEVPGLGTVRTGYDGEVGWVVHPALGPMVLDGLMLDQLRQQADLLSVVHPERYIASRETVEQAEFEGRACYKVRVETVWGEEYWEFYDAETGLVGGVIRGQATAMGELETTTVVSDYQEYDGVLMPTKVVQRVMGMEQIVTTTAVDSDPFDAAVFALPAEITALLEATEEAPEP